MKKLRLLIFYFCCCPGSVAQIGTYQHGTVIKMHIGTCLPAHHGFIMAFGGPATPAPDEPCPEYTLLSNKVVYVIAGKFSNQLIPLAETIDFRLHNNELLVRVDDAKHESRFFIKEMIVRSEWDRIQRHIEDATTAASEHHEGERDRTQD